MPSRPCPGPARGAACPAGAPPVQVARGSKQARRCPACKRAHNAAHNAARPDLHDPDEIRRRAAVVAAANGWCQGDGPDHPPHPSGDLQAHHVDGPGYGRLKALCGRRNAQIGRPNRSNTPKG
jgi:hypothetical protein